MELLLPPLDDQAISAIRVLFEKLIVPILLKMLNGKFNCRFRNIPPLDNPLPPLKLMNTQAFISLRSILILVSQIILGFFSTILAQILQRSFITKIYIFNPLALEMDIK